MVSLLLAPKNSGILFCSTGRLKLVGPLPPPPGCGRGSLGSGVAGAVVVPIEIDIAIVMVVVVVIVVLWCQVDVITSSSGHLVCEKL